MSTIALDRRFLEWREGDHLSDPELVVSFRLADGLSWESILRRWRVVILAEAGSGKTEEMREQARLVSASGKFAVFATVEDVATEGLDGALSAADRALLDGWRGTGEEGWFFIDSIDEAKLGRVRLDRAIRRIADAIHGAERRAHVILSCRLTDWQPVHDLRRLTEGLPIPRDPSLPPPPSPNELVVQVLHTRRLDAAGEPAEKPLVVLMAPLDEERVRLFATGKGAPNLDTFIAQIAAGDLWQFARRPLDLDWLVDFWREHGRFGALTEMLETSLSARVQETNLDRARGDALDATRALHALQRIGGSLVLGRKETIAIPDSDLLRTEDGQPLDVAKVLPDWTPQDHLLLLTRPVFDPATFGRARLHNDNQGVVRAYLTACWLRRMRASKLSRREVFDLLFATSYGIEVIKPSMQETAAWLALWDAEVGREVSRRMPVLLLTAGDPASLPTAVREAALRDVLAALAGGEWRLPMLDHDSLKRFAQPDLAASIRQLWSRYHHEPEATRLLLRLIWLGQLHGCADLAEEIAFKVGADEYARITAGRAIIAAGSDELKCRYSTFVKEHCANFPHIIVLDAIDGLFPSIVTISDLLEILSKIDVAATSGGAGVEWQAPTWIERVEGSQEVQQLLHALLEQLGPEAPDIGHVPDKREEAYLSAIAAAAARLLERCPVDEAPNDTIDAALRLGLADRFGHRAIRERRDISAGLNRSAARRRIAFWRAAEQRNEHRWLSGQPITHIGQIALFGYAPRLGVEDLDWLLPDARARATEHERKLAITTAVMICQEAGSPVEGHRRIEDAASGDPVLSGIVQQWTNPPAPSPEQVKEERKYERVRKQRAAEEAKRDRSWVEFIDRLHKDPGQLDHIRPPTPEGVDARLYHLWLLLCDAIDTNSRYAIDTVAPLEPVLGTEGAAALRKALIGFWRQWEPQRMSERSAAERNRIRVLDCMGITGVTLEAAVNPRWAEQLLPEDAASAAIYGTLELNGFPAWFPQLAAVRSNEVRDVLGREITAELAGPEPRTRYEVLEDIAHAGGVIAELVSPALSAYLRQHDDVPIGALSPMLRIIVSGLRYERVTFLALAIDRFQTAGNEIGALYLGAAFCIDADTAATALSERLERLGPRAQTELAQGILPTLFGTDLGRWPGESIAFSFATLERLVRIAFRTIRHEEDQRHPSGEAYSPDQRDHAEHARGAAFKRLVDTPGRATFAALHNLATDPDCPLDPKRLRELAYERAVQDAESAAWPPGEVAAFEAAAEAAPSTAKDLQHTALRRLDDLQHELLHGDFSQGATLRGLPHENAVQNWIADRFRLRQGRAHSVEREPHVAGEKEPDVRLRAKASDASLAIEIKVAESWSLRELEEALSAQLCGRYLRARDGRYGVLLLVHQHARPKGWEDRDTGQFLTFGQVVDHLRRQAEIIASAEPDAPQPEIAVLDVSGGA